MVSNARHPREGGDPEPTRGTRKPWIPAFAGMTGTGRGNASAQARVKELLAENESLTLSPRDWDVFFSALDRTDAPRPKLEAAAAAYLACREYSGHPGTRDDL